LIAAAAAAVLNLYGLAFLIVISGVLALYALVAFALATSIVTYLIQAAPRAADYALKMVASWRHSSPLHWAVGVAIVALIVATWIHDLAAEPPPRYVRERRKRVRPVKHRRLISAADARAASERLIDRGPSRHFGRSHRS
jgi:hypothetical protein